MQDHADFTEGPIQQHEQDHARSETHLPCLADLDHVVGIYHTDHLSEAWKAWS